MMSEHRAHYKCRALNVQGFDEAIESAEYFTLIALKKRLKSSACQEVQNQMGILYKVRRGVFKKEK